MSEESEESLEPAVPDERKCGGCGFLAKSVAGLKTHQRGKTCLRNQGINVPATFKCGVCGRLFDSQHGLSIHRVTHGSEHRADLAAPFEEDTDKGQEECRGNVEVFRGRMLQWKASFLRLHNGREVDPKELDQLVSDFSDELSKCIDFLPGPRNPNKKYIDLRKKTRRRKTDEQQPTDRTGYATSSNPSRTSKRKKAARQEQLTYDQVQFDYYNQRRRVIRAVGGSGGKKCPLKMDKLMEVFEPRFSTEKTDERTKYQSISDQDQTAINSSFESTVSLSDIRDAVKGIAVDSAAGPDKVLVRIVKQEVVMEVLAVVATLLLEMNAKKVQPLPTVLQLARTVLIHKGGDVTDANNYRPISICSAIRRVLERVVDRHLRRYVSVSRFQQRFTSAPGTHVNASILGSVLRKAQAEKSTAVVVLLDIKRAFEEIPLVHLKKTLQASPLPSPLRNLILSLQENNRTQLQLGSQRSRAIPVKKGVFQGAPLSPMLYNISTDYVTRNMTEVPVAEEFGFSLCEGEQPVTLLTFADDSTVIAKSREAAVQLTEMAIGLFKEIGLEVSPAKSKAIIVEKGVLSEAPLCLPSGDVIEATKKKEKVRYLGATVTDQLDFDQEKVIKQLTDQVDRLVHFPHLHADQKLNLLNQWLWPSIIYPLQTAPINTIPKAFLQTVDKIVKSAVREILQLPTDTPEAFMYAPRKYRGLGLMRAVWESQLQHISICHALLKDGNRYIFNVRDIAGEIESSVAALNIPAEKIPPRVNEYGVPVNPARQIREELRAGEFERWSQMERAGGVHQYKVHTQSNKWVYNRCGLTNAEWISSLKMTVNGAPVRSLHGRSKDGPACRAPGCEAERETLSHVLGSCHKGNLLRNSRHNKIRTMIAEAFRGKDGLEVYEEVPCIAENDSSRRVDIIIIDRGKCLAWIVDPTVRYEGGEQQAMEVDEEKKRIYEPCVRDLKAKYRMEEFEVEVIGLYMGARGTISRYFLDFCRRFSLPKDLINRIVIAVLKGSCSILHNHLYSQQPVTTV